MKTAKDVATGLLESSEQATRALASARHHEERFEHHQSEAGRHGAETNGFEHHDHAAALHFEAAKHYRKAAKHHSEGKENLGHRAAVRGWEWAERAQIHKEENGISEGFVSKAAGIAARVAVPQFGDIAQAGAEYAAERGEDYLRRKLHKIGNGVKSGARFVRKLTGDKKEPVTEATRKDEIDDIGKYHGSMTNVGKVKKNSAAAEYHVTQRNRASRLKNMRDHTGPNAPATKHTSGRKMMLKFAGEDSRAAKIAKAKIRPNDYVKEGHESDEDDSFDRTKNHLIGLGMNRQHIDRSADSHDQGQGSWVHVHHDWHREQKKVKGLHAAVTKSIKSGELEHHVTDKGNSFRLRKKP